MERKITNFMMDYLSCPTYPLLHTHRNRGTQPHVRFQCVALIACVVPRPSNAAQREVRHAYHTHTQAGTHTRTHTYTLTDTHTSELIETSKCI